MLRIIPEGFAVVPVNALVGPEPHVALPVFVDGINGVVDKSGGTGKIGQRFAVVPHHAFANGAEPQLSLRVLKNTPDVLTDEGCVEVRKRGRRLKRPDDGRGRFGGLLRIGFPLPVTGGANRQQADGEQGVQ